MNDGNKRLSGIRFFVILTVLMLFGIFTGCDAKSDLDINQTTENITAATQSSALDTKQEKATENITEATQNAQLDAIDEQSGVEQVEADETGAVAQMDVSKATGDTRIVAGAQGEVTVSYSGRPYAVINDNVPSFTADEKSNTTAFENYSELDGLGRCGVAYANICKEIMPTETRGAIGSVKPSGWHTVKYDIVDGKYLYNRCHLIGYQLAGENANNKNLITGTRYLNINGMLPFENLVSDYVKETNNHVLYRVTPVFDGDNLVASGVQMEAWSVEDKGSGICFNVFCFNVQPGITINYTTGDSQLGESDSLTVELSGMALAQAEGNATQTAGQVSGVEQSTAEGKTSQSEKQGTAEATPSTEPASDVLPSSEPAENVSQEVQDISSGSVQPADSASEQMVWLSATGSSYHSINNCGNMNPNKATQMTESDAIAQGKKKCSKCW